MMPQSILHPCRGIRALFCLVLGWSVVAATSGSQAAESPRLFPPAAAIRPDRPRLLLRPETTPHAVSLQQLRSSPLDAEGRQLLEQLRNQNHAAAQAMVWLLTGEEQAAEKALRRLQDYRLPDEVDTFHVFLRLTEFALAYDWLYDHPAFTEQRKAAVRENVRPLAELGLRYSDDHVFHNYIWMSAGGCAWWALATVGDDPVADRLYAAIAARFDDQLFPAMRCLDGLPSEPMGYWALYDLTPAVMTVIALESACQADRTGVVQAEQGDWLNRHFDNLVHSVLPDMRYIPWGDLQSGPNGGVTYEMAGLIDAANSALDSPGGVWLSHWLAAKQGLRRFYGATAIYYFLYSRNLKTHPEEPPLSFLAGGSQAGHFITRSNWADDATIVTLRCTDHFGDHNHYDQGSFIVYRDGLLAVDPPVYQRIRGPQQATENHNTLLLNGRPQRPVRGQSFRSVQAFRENLAGGRRLETGDMLFHTDQDGWAAASGQFAQAYEPQQFASCVRQVLFVRPDKILVVDQVAASQTGEKASVDWLLHLPREPVRDGTAIASHNGRSWIRVRPLQSPEGHARIEKTPVGTYRVAYRYSGELTSGLAHIIEVGAGIQAAPAADVELRIGEDGLEITLEDQRFEFRRGDSFEVVGPATAVAGGSNR